MPLPAIAIALVATEITASDLIIAAGGTVLLIGLQSQINTYLNENHIKNYRSVSPQEINSRTYRQVMVFSNYGQQLLLFSTQLEIEWVKKEYLQWQSQIQSSYCNIKDELRKFLVHMQNKNNSSSDQTQIQIKSFYSRFEPYEGGSPNPNKNNKNKKDEEKDIKKKEITKREAGKTPEETEGSIIDKYSKFQNKNGYNGGNIYRPSS